MAVEQSGAEAAHQDDAPPGPEGKTEDTESDLDDLKRRFREALDRKRDAHASAEGAEQAKLMDRVSADHMGMLATVINALALQDALEKAGAPTRVMTAIQMHQVAEPYIRRRAIRHFEKGRIVLFAAGTSNPYFSTDTAATLRALEIHADVIAKGTRVEGVYDKDPLRHDDAVLYPEITYNEVLSKALGVLDASAVAMCRDNQLPILVFNLNVFGNIMRMSMGEPIGTLIH